MGNCSKYIDFDMALTQLIQNSGIDDGAMYYILKCFLKNMEDRYYASVNSEQMAMQEEGNESDEDISEN